VKEERAAAVAILATHCLPRWCLPQWNSCRGGHVSCPGAGTTSGNVAYHNFWCFCTI